MVFGPTKSYLASDRGERGQVMRDVLGCVPYDEGKFGLHTLHAQDPDATRANVARYGEIHLEEMSRRADEVAKMIRENDGKFQISSI